MHGSTEPYKETLEYAFWRFPLTITALCSLWGVGFTLLYLSELTPWHSFWAKWVVSVVMLYVGVGGRMFISLWSHSERILSIPFLVAVTLTCTMITWGALYVVGGLCAELLLLHSGHDANTFAAIACGPLSIAAVLSIARLRAVVEEWQPEAQSNKEIQLVQ
jgi:hypothetical protein